jgi:hypothetical protein
MKWLTKLFTPKSGEELRLSNQIKTQRDESLYTMDLTFVNARIGLFPNSVNDLQELLDSTLEELDSLHNEGSITEEKLAELKEEEQRRFRASIQKEFDRLLKNLRKKLQKLKEGDDAKIKIRLANIAKELNLSYDGFGDL